jgi:hypothetical protein|tara:strand:- start:280 stop:594 length:315 start_codon:yes stop_codon:yes gene_type:complete
MTNNYYVVIQGLDNPNQVDTDDFLLMTFRSEEFAIQVAENLLETFEDEYFFYVTDEKPEDYLEDSHPSIYTMLITKVYSTVMQAVDSADEQLSKRKKPYLRVVK